MSFWDTYLAPGDLRQRHQQTLQAQQQKEQTSQQQQAAAPPPQRIDAAHRARRQNALLYGGLAFTALSLFVTRRTLRRKNLQNTSANGAAGVEAGSKVDGGLEAAHALGIATLNVFSMAMMSVGAAFTYFDIADVEDMREGVRKSLGYDVHGGESEGDREIEEWVAGVLKEGEEGKKGGVVEEMVRQVAGMEGVKKSLEDEKKRREEQR